MNLSRKLVADLTTYIAACPATPSHLQSPLRWQRPETLCIFNSTSDCMKTHSDITCVIEHRAGCYNTILYIYLHIPDLNGDLKSTSKRLPRKRRGSCISQGVSHHRVVETSPIAFPKSIPRSRIACLGSLPGERPVGCTAHVHYIINHTIERTPNSINRELHTPHVLKHIQ